MPVLQLSTDKHGFGHHRALLNPVKHNETHNPKRVMAVYLNYRTIIIIIIILHVYILAVFVYTSL